MIAITRQVPASIAECQLTHVEREPIDVSRARQQHAEYEQALRTVGAQVVQLAEEPLLSDSVFVEDTAIVLDEVAVLMRPGAPSRRAEVASVAQALAPLRRVLEIGGEATIDGGDVLVLGRTLWVGRSSRTNAAGVAQLGALVAPFGYTVRAAAVHDALHLKTAVTQVGEGTVLLNPAWVYAPLFCDIAVVEVDPDEPFAANAVLVNGRVIHSLAFPRTQERLRARGIDVLGVDASELAKAEGGVTCCSLLVS